MTTDSSASSEKGYFGPTQTSGSQASIDRVVSRVTANAGALGPLEQPIDLETKIVSSHVDTDDINANDPWKYPFDRDLGGRIVQFTEGDKHNPRNFSFAKKWTITIVLGLICFAVAFSSAVVTGDMEGPMEAFHVSEEVSILTVTLFVIGFGVGPLVFSPLSEEVGRQVIYISTLFMGLIFVIPCAVAKNIGTLLVCRFIDGIAFSAPITLIGGSLSDIFSGPERGTAMAIFSAAPFCGPILGPVVGGFVGMKKGWRWNYWLILIFTGFIYGCTLVFVPETHHETILRRRAKKLIKDTGDKSYITLGQLKKRSIGEIAKETITRPLILLTELIVFLLTMYMSVIYGLLYMFFFAFPEVYGKGKGWNDGLVGLMFLGVGLGVVLATGMAPFINKDYNRRSQKFLDNNELPPPELRLWPMLFSCWLLPIGLFIFAWTSYPRLSWVGPCIAGIPCGIGFLLIYNSANNYIVDSYQHYAASALASKTLVRSLHGATCVLYTVQMINRLGYEWAISLLAFISLAFCVVPYLFFFYGARIRARSKYAYKPDPEQLTKS